MLAAIRFICEVSSSYSAHRAWNYRARCCAAATVPHGFPSRPIAIHKILPYVTQLTLQDICDTASSAAGRCVAGSWARRSAKCDVGADNRMEERLPQRLPFPCPSYHPSEISSSLPCIYACIVAWLTRPRTRLTSTLTRRYWQWRQLQRSNRESNDL